MSQEATSDRPTLRLLVCDDQELVRTGLATVLARQPDLEVVGEAADGVAAVALARRLRPDVVVMDVRMPVLDGIEATRRLAGPQVDDPVKVLVVTTFHVDEHVYDALRAGASGFLLKDARPDELVQAVRTVAAGDALLAPAVTRALIGAHAERVHARTGQDTGGMSARLPPQLAGLAPREVEVLRLIAAGSSNAEIGAALFLGTETVKTYVSRILTKLGLRDRVQAVVLAYEVGLVVPGG